MRLLPPRSHMRIVLLVVSLAACGTDVSHTNGVVVRDSAGVRIVEIQVAVDTLPHWHVADSATTTIGVVSGDPHYELHRVRHTMRLRDGAIAVVNTGSQEVRFYTREGEYQRSVGGRGQGPGEFQGLRDVAVTASDTLLVLQGETVARFDGRGTFVSQRTVDVLRFKESTREDLGPLWVLPDGSLLFILYQFANPTAAPTIGPFRPPTGYARISVEEGHRYTFGWFPGAEQFAYESGDLVIGGGMRPLGLDTKIAVGGGKVFIGDNDTYEIRVYAFEGVLERLIRLNRDRVGVTSSDVERIRAEWKQVLQQIPAASRPTIRRHHSAAPFPETLPAFADLKADRDANLWVMEYPRNELASHRWVVFDPSGFPLATVATPAGLRIDDIGSDYVLGLVRDELGVEYVRLYRLTK